MTAVAAPAPLAGGPRPVQWTKLVWVTWRQHRAALAGVAVLLGGVGLYLLIMGVKIHSGYASVTSCHPARSAACGLADQLFTNDYYPTAQTMTGFLQVIPALVGVFVGGPVLAREWETGTFRFAWTQGCGRMRWAGIAGCAGIGPKLRSTSGRMSAASTSPAITRIALFGA